MDLNNYEDYSPLHNHNIRNNRKSSLSPVISQLMRKDKEISSLHDEISQLQKEILDYQMQIKNYEQELNQKEQFIEQMHEQISYNDNSCELENIKKKLSLKMKKCKEWKKKYDEQKKMLDQSKQQLEKFNQCKIKADQYDELKLKYESLQNDYKGLQNQLIEYQKDINTQQSMYLPPQINSNDRNNNFIRGKLSLSVNPLKKDAKPIKQELSPEKEEPQQDNFQFQMISTLLDESVERERILHTVIEKLVSKLMVQTNRIKMNEEILEIKVKKRDEEFQALLNDTYDQQLFYKEKCEVQQEIFSKILEINYKQSSLTEISEAYEEFGVSFQNFFIELAQLYTQINEFEKESSSLLSIKKIINQLIQNFQSHLEIQLLREQKKSQKAMKEKDELVYSINELLHLCLDEHENLEITERVRKIVQIINRQQLEIMKNKEDFKDLMNDNENLIASLDQSKHIIIEIENEKNSCDKINQKLNYENEELKRRLDFMQKEIERKKLLIEESQQTIRQIQEEKAFRSQQHKKNQDDNSEQLTNYYKHLLTQKDQELQFMKEQLKFDLDEQNKKNQNEKKELIEQFDKKIQQICTDFQFKTELEQEEQRKVFDSKLEQQEQRYMQIFQQMQQAIKVKDKEYEILKENFNDIKMENKRFNLKQKNSDKSLLETSQISYKPAETQKKAAKSFLLEMTAFQDNENISSSINQSELNRVVEYYKCKSKQHYEKKVKEFEKIIFYIEEITKGYNPKLSCYVINSLVSENYDSQAAANIQQQIDVIFYKNPELQKFIKKIETNVQSLYSKNLTNIFDQTNLAMTCIQQYQTIFPQFIQKLEKSTLKKLQQLQQFNEIIQQQFLVTPRIELKFYGIFKIFEKSYIEIISQIEANIMQVISSLTMKSNEKNEQSQQKIDDQLISRNLADSFYKYFDEKPEKEQQRSSQKTIIQSDIQRILLRQHNLKLDNDLPEKAKYNSFIEKIKQYKDNLCELMQLFIEGVNSFAKEDIIEDIQSKVLIHIQKMTKQSIYSRETINLVEDLISVFKMVKISQLNV